MTVIQLRVSIREALLRHLGLVLSIAFGQRQILFLSPKKA
jgi:hypothetical protein